MILGKAWQAGGPGEESTPPLPPYLAGKAAFNLALTLKKEKNQENQVLLVLIKCFTEVPGDISFLVCKCLVYSYLNENI